MEHKNPPGQPGFWHAFGQVFRRQGLGSKAFGFLVVAGISSLCAGASLMYFHAGARSIEPHSKAPWKGQWIEGTVAWMSTPEGVWIPLFTVFMISGIAAVLLDYWAFRMAVRIAVEFECRVRSEGYALFRKADPRDLTEYEKENPLRIVEAAARGMRIILLFQLLVVSSLVLVVFPLGNLILLNVWFGIVTAILVLGMFAPMLMFAKRAASISEAGLKRLHKRPDRQISSRIWLLGPGRDLPRVGVGGPDDSGDEAARGWGEQRTLRKAASKLPGILTLAVTYILLIVGIAYIQRGELSWAELLTFLVGFKVVMGPLGPIASLITKIGEAYSRAKAYMALRTFLVKANEGQTSKVGRVQGTFKGIRLGDGSVDPHPATQSPTLNLDLQPGAWLSIVPLDAAGENRLFLVLTGQAYAGIDGAQLNGRPIDTLSKEAIDAQIHRISVDFPWDRVDRSDLRSWIFDAAGSAKDSRERLESLLSPEARKKLWDLLDGPQTSIDKAESVGRWARSVTVAVQLARLFDYEGGGILAVDARGAGPECVEPLILFHKRFAGRFAVVFLAGWIPEGALLQTVALFRSEKCLGLFDAEAARRRLGSELGDLGFPPMWSDKASRQADEQADDDDD